MKFSENGIKAAAVTIFATQNSLSTVKSVRVNLNRPFVFVIKDKATGETWSAGTVYQLEKLS